MEHMYQQFLTLSLCRLQTEMDYQQCDQAQLNSIPPYPIN